MDLFGKIEIVKQEIASLSYNIEQHNYNYYQLSMPTISDFEFDQLLKKLIDLEKEYPVLILPTSPTQRIGGSITKNFKTVQHINPMLSLGNTYSAEDLIEFDNRIKKAIETDYEYVCELKYDGVAIGLRYEKGILTQAVTRGDGVQGDDVTANVKTIKTVPLIINALNLPNSFEIRGEIFLSKEQFAKINKDKEQNNEALLANPRNAASGTIKMQDSSIVAQRNLDCFLYSVYTNDNIFETHEASLQAAHTWGFKVGAYYKKCNTINDVLAYINYWDKERHLLPFDIDGIVIKLNNTQQQRSIGFTAKTPRWAISYKFKAAQALTQLNEITYQVGRTGNITPVANLTPVELAGTVVKRATLHNADFISELDLRKNDYVYIEKGGEIIPKIMRVAIEKRVEESTPFTFITNCPECNSILIRPNGEANHYCLNELHCPPQQIGKIIHFASRKAMNIDGLGDETINLFFSKGLIKNYADIYTLNRETLQNIERFGQKSIDNLFDGIANSKSITFEKVLFALGIRHVGETTAKKLVQHFHNIDNIMNASEEQLLEANEVGEKIASTIFSFFRNDENISMIEVLKNAGLQFAIDENKIISKGTSLLNMICVVSGVFSTINRDGLKALIEQNGGKVSGSISKKTNYLVAGDNMGPEKRKKAEELNVTIISEDNFLQLLNSN